MPLPGAAYAKRVSDKATPQAGTESRSHCLRWGLPARCLTREADAPRAKLKIAIANARSQTLPRAQRRDLLSPGRSPLHDLLFRKRTEALGAIVYDIF